MANEQRTEEEQRRLIANRRHFSFRLNLFFFSTFVLFSVLIVQLAILQFVRGPELRAERTSSGSRTVQIPPIRGNIYDATGQPIAYSVSTQSLYFTMDRSIKEAEARKIAEELNEVFTQYGDPNEAITIEQIIERMDINFRQNNMYTPRLIKYNLTKQEIAYFSENSAKFPNISIVEDTIRHYDDDTVAVQLVGYLKNFDSAVTSAATKDFYEQKRQSTDPTLRYLNDEDVGMDGLELMYQDVLRGRNGVKTYPVNSHGEIIGEPVITKPEKGSDLHLTIHRDVQLATEKAILDHIEYLRNAPKSSGDRAEYARAGYAVAIEVDTGKVIAMASMPDYDPNVWKGGQISPSNYEATKTFHKNGAISQAYQDWGSQEEANKHPSSLVPLGSTQKPLTVLIGLAEGLITPKTTYNDTGVFQFGREGYRVSIRNAEKRAFGRLTPSKAIEKSSNTFMAEMIGNALYRRDGRKGVEIWDNWVKQFGLGVLTESGLPGESKGVIDYFHEAENGSPQSALIYASFGQQGRYTTLQLAQYAATLANRGKRLKPQFVERIVDADGRTVETFQPVVLNTIDLPDEYWDVIISGMKSNVRGFEGFPYDFRRKTGTSEQQTSVGIIENAVFIAFAPADKPKLAVAVVVPEGGYGGRGAAPIARKIFDAYDHYIGLTGAPKKNTLVTQQSDADEGHADGSTTLDETPADPDGTQTNAARRSGSQSGKRSGGNGGASQGASAGAGAGGNAGANDTGAAAGTGSQGAAGDGGAAVPADAYAGGTNGAGGASGTAGTGGTGAAAGGESQGGASGDTGDTAGRTGGSTADTLPAAPPERREEPADSGGGTGSGTYNAGTGNGGTGQGGDGPANAAGPQDEG
ncbi:cell division protein FtsI/penicillin-binding protein 2 [Thermobacillus composti KWC4]|uniref:Cell division protein FtsI/penicillin-binding protein 2 n=1 Tax=Thermobacillus composti (strain DSM 18247 / JCM 13945 / KWC4) TaxID=717605 RepID=L0E9R5_THECK|nr:cell division protein FtsI/penicillin-binding protein 2 [Thermobacillus composti KWC4]